MANATREQTPQIEYITALGSLTMSVGVIDGARVVSFLPMAHIAERQFSHYRSIVHGFITHPAAAIDQVPRFLMDVHPHYVFSPPRLFEKIRGAYEARIEGEADPERKKAIRDAIATGYEYIDTKDAGREIAPELEERFASARAAHLTPLLAQFGLDEAATAITGAAPVQTSLVRFYRALGLPIFEGWG